MYEEMNSTFRKHFPRKKKKRKRKMKSPSNSLSANSNNNNNNNNNERDNTDDSDVDNERDEDEVEDETDEDEEEDEYHNYISSITKSKNKEKRTAPSMGTLGFDFKPHRDTAKKNIYYFQNYSIPNSLFHGKSTDEMRYEDYYCEICNIDCCTYFTIKSICNIFINGTRDQVLKIVSKNGHGALMHCLTKVNGHSRNGYVDLDIVSSALDPIFLNDINFYQGKIQSIDSDCDKKQDNYNDNYIIINNNNNNNSNNEIDDLILNSIDLYQIISIAHQMGNLNLWKSCQSYINVCMKFLLVWDDLVLQQKKEKEKEKEAKQDIDVKLNNGRALILSLLTRLYETNLDRMVINAIDSQCILQLIEIGCKWENDVIINCCRSCVVTKILPDDVNAFLSFIDKLDKMPMLSDNNKNSNNNNNNNDNDNSTSNKQLIDDILSDKRLNYLDGRRICSDIMKCSKLSHLNPMLYKALLLDSRLNFVDYISISELHSTIGQCYNDYYSRKAKAKTETERNETGVVQNGNEFAQKLIENYIDDLKNVISTPTRSGMSHVFKCISKCDKIASTSKLGCQIMIEKGIIDVFYDFLLQIKSGGVSFKSQVGATIANESYVVYQMANIAVQCMDQTSCNPGSCQSLKLLNAIYEQYKNDALIIAVVLEGFAKICKRVEFVGLQK